MRVCELREKEVINICDGERLVNLCVVDFDVNTCHILSLVFPGPCNVFGLLGRDHEYVIPYECVKRIGTDVILVDVDLEKCKQKCKFD